MPDWLLWPLAWAIMGGLAGWLVSMRISRREPAQEPSEPFQRTHDHERLIASLRSWLSDEKVVRVILDSRVMLGADLLMTRNLLDVILAGLERMPEAALWDIARRLLAPRAVRVALLARETGTNLGQWNGVGGWRISDLLQSERLYERRAS